VSNRTKAHEEVTLSPADRASIDDLCDEFEAAWRKLNWPRMEEFLPRSETRLRRHLFTELLKIDCYWRRQSADADDARADLLTRFPEETRAILDAWGPEGAIPSLVTQQTSLGPFHDLERIGEGGFGIVFRAWDSRHRRFVALKLPRFGFELAGQDLDRFLREARAAGSLDHPGIARVWDSGRVAGVTYIAYQFIKGENLKARLEEVARWPILRIAGFVAQLAEAIQFAHDQGIVHRDIKPSNVLLTGDDRPVLTDFGLALAAGGDMTRSLAARVGTLDYMSPEQASGDSAQVDGRADLWSLGVLMYELLAGRKPFEGATEVEVLRMILENNPRPPRSLRTGIPHDLDLLTMRCLEKRRIDRLPSCRLLAEELRRVQCGEPIVSRRVSFVERTVRWCRRNPKPVATFGLILLATTFGAWSWGGWVYDNRQNESVVQQLQIQIETNHAQRRRLLDELLKQGQLLVGLAADDLEFVESRFQASDDLEVLTHAAVLLARHGWLSKERFPLGTRRNEQCVERLESILSSQDESLSQPLREELRAALAALKAD
jgi:serine/threonine protein kinase